MHRKFIRASARDGARASRPRRRRNRGAVGEHHPHDATADPVKIGIIYSRTGALAAYGAEYIQGLRYGLSYATKGKLAVGGSKIELTLVDDAGDPAKAVSAAKDLIGKGYKILAGTTSSGVALQMAPLAPQNNILYISGPAATDALQGINKNTFRSGRQSYQDVLAASSYLGGGGGKNVVVFAQDSAFGLSNYLAVNQVMGNLGGQKVARVLVPQSAQDFTAVRHAGQEPEARPPLRRLGRHDCPGDVARARAAGCVRHGRQGRHGSLRACDVADVRAGRVEDLVPLALRLQRAEEQGQRLARHVDAQAGPGAGSLHAGRLRRRADDRPRAREGIEDGRRAR